MKFMGSMKRNCVSFQKIQSVNLAQVNQVAKQLLHPDKLVVVTAGPDVSAQGKSRRQKAKFSLCLILCWLCFRVKFWLVPMIVNLK